jgi:methionyl-tRNA formyltransferase
MKIKNLKLRIIFFGTPGFVDPVLKTLEENFDVVLTVRDPKQFRSIINNQSSIVNKADLFVVASFGVILPGKVLQIPKFGALNIHPSLLPKYRGPSPIQTAILNGDKTTGVTIIKMDEEVDHGPVLYQKEVSINDNETFESLAERLFEIGAKALPQTISKHIARGIKLTKQNEKEATFTTPLSRKDGFIDPSIINNQSSIINIDRMIRAYYPWPGVWTKAIINNKLSIIKFLPKRKIQVEGKNSMTYKDFINGYQEGEELIDKLGLN